MRSNPQTETENDVVPSPNIATPLNQITPTPISTGAVSMNITSDANTATLNENELFENFMHSSIEERIGKSKKTRSLPVADILGGFENRDLEEFCERIVKECSDERYSSLPANNLYRALEEARILVKQLEVFHGAFEAFKDLHWAEEESTDEENRFRVPAFASEKEAA